MSGVHQELPSEAIAALERGHKIEAIKCVRIAHGVGLKEAKETVDQFVETNPHLKGRLASANAESVKGGLKWLLLIAGIGAAAYYFLAGNP